MSNVLEKSIGGFINSVFGSESKFTQYSENGVGLENYVKRLEAARKISKQEEEDIIREEYQEWLRQASHQSTKNEIIADYLCRSLIAFSRGHYFTNLHINAIKLTQSDKLLHKKIGYLYISRTMASGSDLTVLLVNTVQRDLASPNVIEVSMGLSLIPIILSAEITSLVSNSLVHCLNHQQVYIKRRAAIMAYEIYLHDTENEDSFNLLMPYLIQLLSDSQPSVAIAAISTLSKTFKVSRNPETNKNFCIEIAKAAAHVLLQCTKGNLSRHYNIGTIQAPFIQVKMLRAIRNITGAICDPPEEVYCAVGSVLQQPWGGRNLSLYMTLIEAVQTVVCLPRRDELVSLSLKIILGFLKSSLVDFKYLGIKALGGIFRTLEDMLTESHLKAVLECLDSSNKLLQSKTIKLLCSMANNSNYQPICVTLMEFSHKSSDVSTQNLITNDLSDILKRVDTNLPWCISFFSPLLSSSDPNSCFLEAVEASVLKGIKAQKTEEELEVIIESCNKLFCLLLEQNTCLLKLKSVAYILNIMFEFKPGNVDINFVNTFLDKIAENYENFESQCKDILTCLFNCGLFLPESLNRVKSVLCLFLNKEDINLRLKVREKFLLLNNISLTKKVYERKAEIESGEHKMDFTLSFCDEWVIKALEKDKEACDPSIFKTRPITKTPDKKIFNPFNTNLTESLEKDNISLSESITSSHFGSGSTIGIYPRDRIWTAKGRMKSVANETDDDTITGCVEIAHEAEESLILDEEFDRQSSISSSFLESQKVDLTQALLKGLGLTKK